MYNAPSWRQKLTDESTLKKRVFACTAFTATGCTGSVTGLGRLASAVAVTYNNPTYSMYGGAGESSTGLGSAIGRGVLCSAPPQVTFCHPSVMRACAASCGAAAVYCCCIGGAMHGGDACGR